MKILKISLLIIAIVAATMGGTFFFLTKMGVLTPSAQAATAPAAEPILPSPIFLALEPFTVTLDDTHSSRILYLEITVRTGDDTSSKQLVQYMPEVRNRILTELAKRNATQVQTVDGRGQLANDLAAALRAPYKPQPRGPEISDVLFTAFVVQ